MADITTDELLQTDTAHFNTNSLQFVGLRGDPDKHLSRDQLIAGLTALPPAPRDQGQVALLLARGPDGQRTLPESARLTVVGGMPGDRWADSERYGPVYQLATTRIDIARLVANGQPLELHGDNLFLDLDLSTDNLPIGSRVRAGEALLEVTPKAHNGCKKWAQRFGLDALKLNMSPDYRPTHLRGIYFQVVEDGLVRIGDAVTVVHRAPAAAD